MTIENTTDKLCSKIILFYTPYFNDKPWGPFLPIKDYTKTGGCNFDRCEISYNINDYNKADIVFFSCEIHAKYGSIKKIKEESQKGSILDVFCYGKPI